MSTSIPDGAHPHGLIARFKVDKGWVNKGILRSEGALHLPGAEFPGHTQLSVVLAGVFTSGEFIASGCMAPDRRLHGESIWADQDLFAAPPAPQPLSQKDLAYIQNVVY
ncbi:MAG: hypothetical protein IPH59_07850 [bacterium]|nr:hypothetical protein [bacterium]